MEASSSPVDPLKSAPDTDFQVWRRKVANWVDLVVSASKVKTDKFDKTILATLGRQLYDRGLPSAQQSVVDEYQAKGAIDYKQENQVQAVIEIVNLVAKDPPIATVTRLISSFNKVISCRRKKHEDLPTFVSRFRGLVAEHLMHTGVSSSSQTGEVLAITLLNNANLEDGTLTNAKMQLIGLAEARQRDEDLNQISISSRDITELKEKLHSIEDILKPASVVNSRSAIRKYCSTIRRDILDVLDDTKKHVSFLESKGEDEQDFFSEITRSQAHKCTIQLDDAVTVLRNLSGNVRENAKMMTRDQVESVVHQRIQKALLSSQPPKVEKDSRDKQEAKSKRDRKRKQRSPEKYCYDCGSPDHVRGSLSCDTPSFRTKQIRKERSDNPEKKQASNKEKRVKFFQNGSSPESK